MQKLKKLAVLALLAGSLIVQTACNSKAPATQDPRFTATPIPSTPLRKPTYTKMPTVTQEPTWTPGPTRTSVVSASTAAAATQTAAAQDPAAATQLAAVSQPTSASQPGDNPLAPTQPVTTSAVIRTQPAGSVADKYQYVSQNIADNTQVSPGSPMTIIWTVKNVGKTEWTTKYILRYFAGPRGEVNSVAFSKKVGPDSTLDITVPLVAPLAPGTYNTWWKLTNEQGQNFGDVNLLFIVTNTPGSSSATNTPTP